MDTWSEGGRGGQGTSVHGEKEAGRKRGRKGGRKGGRS